MQSAQAEQFTQIIIGITDVAENRADGRRIIPKSFSGAKLASGIFFLLLGVWFPCRSSAQSMNNVETWRLNYHNLGGLIDIPGTIDAPWDGNSSGWREFAIRDVNTGAVLAIAAGDFGRETVRTNRLQWRRPSDGKPVFRWTDILNAWAAPYNLQLAAQSSYGSYSASNTFLVWLGGPEISPYTTDSFPKLIPRNLPPASAFYVNTADYSLDPFSFYWQGFAHHPWQQGTSFSFVNWRNGNNSITCQYADYYRYAVERVPVPVAALSRKGNPALTGHSTLFNAVDVSSGNLHLEFTDMKTDSGEGVRFELRRSYNSSPGNPFFNLPASINGEWLFNFECHARTHHRMSFEDEEPWPIIDLMLPDGTWASYFLAQNGSYISFTSGLHHIVEETYFNDPSFGCPTIKVTTQGTKPIVYTFCNRSSRRTDAAFRLEAIKDLRGNGLNIGYREGTAGRISGIEQIAWVQDSTGRRVNFFYGAGNTITSVSDFTGRSVSYDYDGSGNLLRYYDPVSRANGSATWESYEYGSWGTSLNRLTSLVRPLGNRPIRSLAYDNFGRVTSLTDHNYATTWYQFNQTQTLVDRPGSDSDILFRLDEGGQVTEVVEAYNTGGDRTTTLQRLTASSFSLGPVPGSPQFYRTPDIGLVRNIQSSGGVSTSFSYSDEGRGFLQATQEIGQPEMRIEYDQSPDVLAKNLALPVKITDPRNNVVYPQWGTPFGDLFKMPNALGQGSSVVAFDAYGKSLLTDDGRGFITTRSYTWDGNLSSIQVPDNDPQNVNSRTASYEYDTAYPSAQRGLPSAVVSRGGARTELRWDANDRLIEVIRPSLNLRPGERNKTVTTFDANGNATSFTPRSGAATRYYYDGMDRPTGVVTEAADGDPAISNWVSYDQLGRTFETTDADGVVTRQTYVPTGAGAGLPWQTIAQSAPTPFAMQTIEYNMDGTQRLTRDGEGFTDTFTYDSLKRPVRSTDAQGIYHEVEYDANNNIIRETIGKDGYTGLLPTTLFEYDAANRLTRVINVMNGNRDPNAPENYRVTVTYDALGNPVDVIDAEGHRVRHAYDSLGQLVSVTDAMNRVWQYAYNPDGYLCSEFFPGSGTAMSRSITRTWDVFGRLTRVQFGDAVGSSSDFSYDANDQRIRMEDRRGGNLFQSTDYAYTAQNRLKRLTFQPVNRNALEIGYAFTPAGRLKTMLYPGNRAVNYTHDEVGRMSTVTPWFTNSGNPFRYSWRRDGQLASLVYPNGVTNTAQYNDVSGRLSRLASRRGSNEFIGLDYAWTPADNISQISETQPTPSVPDYAMDMTYDDGNQLKTINGQPVTVDPAGGMLSLPAPFNATATWMANDSLATWQSNGTVHSFNYNGDSERTEHSIAGVTTRYLIDSQPELANVIAESDDAHVPYRFHIYGAQGLLASADTSNTLAGACFHHFNHRGDVLAITDGSGSVTESYGYSPYGRSVASNPSSTNPFRMNGCYGVLDHGQGLVTMRARVYAPMIGSFLSRDQLPGSAAEGLTLNRFAYAGGNPVSNTDPSGREYVNGVWIDFPSDLLNRNAPAPYANTEAGYQKYQKDKATNQKKIETQKKEQVRKRQEFVDNLGDTLLKTASVTSKGLDLLSLSKKLKFPAQPTIFGVGVVDASIGSAQIGYQVGRVRNSNPWKMETWNGYLDVTNTVVKEVAGTVFGVAYGVVGSRAGPVAGWALGNAPSVALNSFSPVMNTSSQFLADVIMVSPSPGGTALRFVQNTATKHRVRQRMNSWLYNNTPFF